MVTVRNDGNTLLTAGFTIVSYREGSSQPRSPAHPSVRSERTHGFGSRPRACRGRFGQRHGIYVKYALERRWARFATHPLVADNGNAVLAPGCTAQFRMSFAIPGWGDEVGKRVTLYAKARNLVALDPVTLEEIRPGANSTLSAVLHGFMCPMRHANAQKFRSAYATARIRQDFTTPPMTADGDGDSSGGGN